MTLALAAAAPGALVALPTLPALPAPALSETTNTSTPPLRSLAIQATTAELTLIILALRRLAEAHLKLAAALPAPGEDNIDGVTFVNIVEPLARRADDHGESELFIKACSGRVAPFVAPAPTTTTSAKGASRALARHYCQWLRSQFVVVKLVALAPTAAVSEAQILRPTPSDVTRYLRYLSQLLPCDDIDNDKLAIIIATLWPLLAVNNPDVSDVMKHQLRQLGDLHRDISDANGEEINWHPRLEMAAVAIKNLLSDAVVKVNVT